MIFEPGFSTADEVTTLSGRGVGMDVVKTNVELIGGSVEIDSQPGAGTTLRLKIPLTLAILPALLVTARGARYAIPQPNVRELVRIKAGSAARGIELVAGAPVYRLRGRLLPLVSLRELFEGQATDWSRVHDGHIVVLTVDGHAFGLVVDECLDTQEIVVKPLGHQLREATLFAGATIMEDGTVALILDALGIATSANLTGEGAALEEEAREPADDAQRGDHRLLLFVSDAGTPMALPLEEVSRLENFPLDTVERVGTHRVVQYGGEALPLVHADEALGAGHVGGARGGRQEGQRRRARVRRPQPRGRARPHPRRGRRAGRLRRHARGRARGDRRGGAVDAARARARAPRRVQTGRVRTPRDGPSGHGSRGMSRSICTFKLDGQTYGVEVAWVQEVLRSQPISAVPRTADVVRGLINLRGRIVTAIDLRTRFELPPRDDERPSMNVVVRTEEGVSSLLVDEIGDVIDVPESDYERPPDTLTGVMRDLVQGVVKFDDGLMLVLDAARAVELAPGEVG